MNKYPLVKLVQWADPGGMPGRKRLQKVVFLLQRAGCPFDAEYALHHYGPYSRDVAETCDELVWADLLNEQQELNNVGTQYCYKATARGAAALEQTEQRLGESTGKIAAFKPLADELIPKDLWELELGSTILFFRDKSRDWDEAVRRACEFKKIDRPRDTAVPSAEALAKKVFARAVPAR